LAPAQKTTSSWINTAAFVNPPIGVYGNSGRNWLRQPGINNWDIGLFKNFQFTERLNLQVRLETFNSFNHSQYAVPINGSGGGCNPDCTLSDASFGQLTSAEPGRILQLGMKFYF
jgi:hypothetical protein